MRSLMLALLVTCALSNARAVAQPDAEASQPIWPPNCTRDMPRDGLLLLDGDLFAAESLTLRRSADGAPVPGAFEPQRPGSLLRWRSHAPLSPDTEYKIEARTQDAAAGPLLVSYFTTGDAFVTPLAFSARPAVRVLARAPRGGSAPDAETVLLRIALPALLGGLPQRMLQVSAALRDVDAHEQAAALRDRDSQAAPSGHALAFEVEAALRDAPSVRCVQITASDHAGQALTLEPELCVNLPARTDAEPDEPAAPAPAFAIRASEQSPEAESSEAHADAGGCAAAGSTHAAGGWLFVLLLAVRRRFQILPG